MRRTSPNVRYAPTFTSQPRTADDGSNSNATASSQETPTALGLLQTVYRDLAQPLSVRLRAAIEALPYENPKLSAVALTSMSEHDFAMRLERAIARSDRAKLIEANAIELRQPE